MIVRKTFKLNKSWKFIESEFSKPYFIGLKAYLNAELEQKEIIYPPMNLIFNAFNLCSFDKLKVVILGQDPYHDEGQAHGLCFSVPDGIQKPPSLVNIFKELRNDLKIPIAKNGNLEKWAKQGILLLNSSLTVRAHIPASHAYIGWTYFTDKVIQKISELKESIIFLLWGKYAQRKIDLIDSKKHFILTAAHPSPLSAMNGFFGCKHFSKTNEILMKLGKEPIKWQI